MHDEPARDVDDVPSSSRCTGLRGGTLLVGLRRAIGGRPVGVVANQPAALAGVLDINASLKGARFIRFATRSTSRS